MALQLYYHPLASYGWKVLIGFYESKLEFEPHIVDLGNPEQRAELEAMWPFAKFPVLRDTTTGEVTPETTILLERLALTHPSARWLLPEDAAKALATRALDRFFDIYIHERMQTIVGDRLRAADAHDPVGVASARATLVKAYGYLDSLLVPGQWAAGDTFSLADCSAYPALYYANRVEPIPSSCGAVLSYLSRLSARPSVEEVMKGAAPICICFQNNRRVSGRRHGSNIVALRANRPALAASRGESRVAQVAARPSRRKHVSRSDGGASGCAPKSGIASAARRRQRVRGGRMARGPCDLSTPTDPLGQPHRGGEAEAKQR